MRAEHDRMRHSVIAAVLTLALSGQLSGQRGAGSPPPDTEIFLAPLSTSAGLPSIGQPVNITNSPGYDNQPSFTPDGQQILFTSNRGGTQTDIFRYDIAGRAIARLTDTPESEYSPTVTPDGAHISVIRVEADNTQRLWRFTIDGKQPALVLAGVKPVGYHAWADDHTLALFVLGTPATLQVADTASGKAEVVVRGIGRSIQKIPGRATISFVEREVPAVRGGAPILRIRELEPKGRHITPLVNAVAGASEADCAWTPDGMLLMAHTDMLYGWKRGDPEWRRVADLAPLGLHGVTRLAVSPKDDRIAFVTQQVTLARQP
jgi:hypothetical protein